MDPSARPKTIGELLGLDKGDSPEARAFRLYLDLDVHDEAELMALPTQHCYHWLAFEYDSEVLRRTDGNNSRTPS